MFVPRDWALVSSKPSLLPHAKVHCRVTPGGHVAEQLHLVFPAAIQRLLHAILEGQNKLQRAMI